MSELMQVKWYATIGRKDLFADAVAEWAPIALKYGATKVAVHVDFDDQYKINQLTWCPNHEAWYAFWEGPEMIEFRARYLGKYQVPIAYAWATEIVSVVAEPREPAPVEVVEVVEIVEEPVVVVAVESGESPASPDVLI